MAPTATTLLSSSLERRALSADQSVLMAHLVVWLLSLVSGILLGLRLFTKWLRAQQLWSDDGFLIASWVVIIFYSAIASLELALGAGRQQTTTTSTFPPPGPSALLLLDNVARSLVLTAAAWSKTSLACTLLRLQSPRLVRAALYAVVGLVNVAMAGAAIAHWLRCRPVAAGWGSGDGACWGIDVQNIVGLSAQTFSAAMDLGLVVVVWKVLWTKGLSVAEKAGVGTLMAMGVLASATSAVAAVQISQLTDANFQQANLDVLLWSSVEPNLTVMIASIPTLRLLRASRSSSSSRGHQKLFSRDGRDKIRIVRTDDSRVSPSPMTIGAPPPIFRQQTAASGSTATVTTTAPPRPPRPTSNQSFWTDSSSILKGGVGDSTTNPGGSNRALAHEASTDDLIQKSPVYSSPGPYSPLDHNNNNSNNNNNNNNTTNNGGLGDTLKPSTNGKRLTPLEEESSLRGSNVSNNINSYNSNFDSYYTNNSGGSGNANANNYNHYRSSSKYSTGAFIDTYGTQARNVVEGMELIVPLSQQQQQQQQQQQGQRQYAPQKYPQYPQYPQQYGYSQNNARQQSPQHKRKPPVAEVPRYMSPVTAKGGYGGML